MANTKETLLKASSILDDAVNGYGGKEANEILTISAELKEMINNMGIKKDTEDARNNAYDAINRFVENNLDDGNYVEFSGCLETLYRSGEDYRLQVSMLKSLLKNLHALVVGECPALLDEDRGGDAKLAMDIEDALKD